MCALPDLPELTQTAWPPRLRRSQAVEYLLACVGGGPSFQKFGRTVLYPRVELDRWAEARISVLRRNTSEAETLRTGGLSHE